jgi:ABC-type bacteriocin/lantibiotic exporter with double-glycine peptidase domain
VNVELAKQLGKAALKSSVDAITGKSQTSILDFIVIGLRIMGVVLFVCSVFQIWFFGPMASVMQYTTENSFFVWLKVAAIGLLSGMSVYGTAEVIALIQKIERHLSKIAEKG